MDLPLFGCPNPSIDARISGVFQVIRKIDETLFSCTRHPNCTSALLAGADLALGCISVYDAKVMECGDILCLLLDEAAWWKFNPDLGNSLSPKIVELCAGTGAMSMGAKYLGADPILAVDWNPKAVDLLSANHPGTTLQLDLTSSDAARQIHAACEGRPGTIFNKASSWAVVTHVLKCYGMACTSPSCSKHNPSFWSAHPWPGTTSRSRTA